MRNRKLIHISFPIFGNRCPLAVKAVIINTKVDKKKQNLEWTRLFLKTVRSNVTMEGLQVANQNHRVRIPLKKTNKQ